MEDYQQAIHRRKEVTERAVQQEPLDGDSLGTYYRVNKKPATQTELEMPQRIKEQGKNELREPLFTIDSLFTCISTHMHTHLA